MKREHLEFQCSCCGTTFVDTFKDTGIYFCPICCQMIDEEEEVGSRIPPTPEELAWRA